MLHPNKFINNVAQRLDLLKQGHTLAKGTHEVAMVLCHLDIEDVRRRVVLIDTPGYPDQEAAAYDKITSWITTK